MLGPHGSLVDIVGLATGQLTVEQRTLVCLQSIEKLMVQLVRNTTTPVTQAAERAHEKRHKR